MWFGRLDPLLARGSEVVSRWAGPFPRRLTLLPGRFRRSGLPFAGGRCRLGPRPVRSPICSRAAATMSGASRMMNSSCLSAAQYSRPHWCSCPPRQDRGITGKLGLARNPGCPSAWKHRIPGHIHRKDQTPIHAPARRLAPIDRETFFTQPAASRIDDAGRRCNGNETNRSDSFMPCETQAASAMRVIGVNYISLNFL